MLNRFAELMVNQSEPSHSNPHVIRRIGDYDVRRLLGRMDHHPATGTSVRSLLWLGQIPNCSLS